MTSSPNDKDPLIGSATSSEGSTDTGSPVSRQPKERPEFAFSPETRALLQDQDDIISEVRIRLRTISDAAEDLTQSALRELALVTMVEVVGRRERERQAERERAEALARAEAERLQAEREAKRDAEYQRIEEDRAEREKELAETMQKEQQYLQERQRRDAAIAAHRKAVSDVKDEEGRNRVNDGASFRAWHGDNEQIMHLWEAYEMALAQNESIRLLRGIGVEEYVRQGVYTPDTNAQAEVVGRRGSVKKVGTLPDIITQMDVDDIDSVVFSNGHHFSSQYPVIRIEFHSRSEELPVQLSVVGKDSTWVVGITASLSKELQRAVPWYAKLRAPIARLVFTLLVTASVALVLARWASNSDLDSNAWTLFLSLIWITFLISWAVKKSVFWAIPAFELSKQGKRGKTARFAAVILGLLSIVPGLVSLFL